MQTSLILGSLGQTMELSVLTSMEFKVKSIRGKRTGDNPGLLLDFRTPNDVCRGHGKRYWPQLWELDASRINFHGFYLQVRRWQKQDFIDGQGMRWKYNGAYSEVKDTSKFPEEIKKRTSLGGRIQKGRDNDPEESANQLWFLMQYGTFTYDWKRIVPLYKR
jgi:hypothetical protein